MPITTLKVLASVLQLHGPGATIQSDHQGIDALLSDQRGETGEATPDYFRRGGLRRGGGDGGWRRAGYHGGGGFRRGVVNRRYYEHSVVSPFPPGTGMSADDPDT